MSILGIGIDIVENHRVKRLLFKKKNNFKNKIFTTHEISYCEKKINVVNCYSKRFAAKEAFVKALGTGFIKNINFKDISVKKNTKGKPLMILSNSLKKFLKHKFKINKYQLFLSLSDEKKHSIAFVIINKIK